MINLLDKIHNVLQSCHPDGKKTIELDYYELSKIYATLKAQELYGTTMEKCLMDGFDKVDSVALIESPSNDEYKKLAEESNEKNKSDIKTLNDKFFKSVNESIDRKLTMKYGEIIK